MTTKKYIEELIFPFLHGGKIVETFFEDKPEDENNPFFGFVVKNEGKRYIVWVNSDSEGNSPGWLDIQKETEK